MGKNNKKTYYLTALKEILDKKGISIYELSKKCGLKKNLYRWDYEIPTLKQVITVTKELDISIDDFVKRVEKCERKGE